MKLGFLKKRWQRRLLRTVVVSLGVVLALGFAIDLYWAPILAKKLKSTIVESSNGLYQINFTDADLDILQGKLSFYNIDFVPDSGVYQQRKRLGIAPNNLYKLHVKKLSLRHIHPFRLYFKHRLDIGSVILTSPIVQAQYVLNHKKDTAINSQTIYQRISKTFKSVHIGHIEFNGVQFNYHNYAGPKVAATTIKEMNITATDLLIDSATQTDKSRFLYCRDIITEVNNFSGKTGTGLYAYDLKQLKLSTRTSQLNISGLRLRPANVNTFFTESQSDRFVMDLDSVQINKFDFLNYHKYRTFNAQSVVINKGRLGVFNNPNKVKKNNDKFTTFPNAGLYKLKLDLKIDTVLFSGIDIAYTELNKRSLKTGTAVFSRTGGRMLNVTTRTDVLAKNPICPISITSHFMNRGKLTVSMNFNLADPKLPYSYKGHLGPMDLDVVNTATMPLAMVKINKGRLQSFDFDMDANRYYSKGKVSLLYNDLKITVLKPDTAQNKLKKMLLMSLFANAMIIKHNNPDNPGEAPRVFYVNEQRPADYAFFKTIWKTLLKGIRSCVGYGEEKEHNVKAQMADRKEKKAQREVKRAQRKAKRAEKRHQKAMEEQDEQ